MPEETHTEHYKGFEIKTITPEGADRPEQLFINDTPITVMYVGSTGSYFSHLFFKGFESVIDLAKAYIDVNPTLQPPHPDMPESHEANEDAHHGHS